MLLPKSFQALEKLETRLAIAAAVRLCEPPKMRLFSTVRRSQPSQARDAVTPTLKSL